MTTPEASHNPEPPDHRENKLRDIVFSVMGIGATALMIGNLAAHAFKEKTEETPLANPCPPPTKQALSATRTLLNTAPDTIDPTTLGIWFYNDNHRELERTSSDTAAGFKTLLRKANKFSKLYDVDISVGTSQSIDEAGWSVPSETELTSSNTKEAVESITQSLSRLPVQYIHASGLKRIVLLSSTTHMNDEVAYVTNDGPHANETIYYNIATPVSDQEVIAHETFHLLDAKMCGIEGRANDPAFIQLSPEGTYLDHSDSTAMEDSVYTENELIGELYRAADDRDKVRYCKYYRKLGSVMQKNVTVTEYSFTSPAEDKAEIGVALTEPIDYEFYRDPLRPVIKNKLEFLLARLYQLNSNLVKYFAATATEPPPANSSNC